jgi:hypothetical protein
MQMNSYTGKLFLAQRMDCKRAQIVDVVGSEGFDFVRSTYVDLLAAIQNGGLGGAIVRARR